jgi:hypothetical protein
MSVFDTLTNLSPQFVVNATHVVEVLQHITPIEIALIPGIIASLISIAAGSTAAARLRQFTPST